MVTGTTEKITEPSTSAANRDRMELGFLAFWTFCLGGFV
jgi:hypothetical protein